MVREVFGKSKLDRSQNPIVIVYPTNWWLGYTLGERLGIAVLRERISLDEYFDEQGLQASPRPSSWRGRSANCVPGVR